MGRPVGILQRPSTNGVIAQQQTSSADSAADGHNSSSDSVVTLVTHNNGGLAALLPKDDDYGGHTRRPTEPIVKILRRPEHKRTSPVVNDKPRQPVKTLQQREQEYAEARLRILGAAQSPDDAAPAATPASAAPSTPGSNE